VKKTLVLAAALALSLAGAPAAFAQDSEPADCAAAVTALNAADVAHRDAADADDKFQTAKDADDDLKRAERLLAEAEEALEKTNNDARHDNPETAEDESTVTAEEQRSIDAAEALVNTRTAERDEALVKANKTDADELRRKANKTDAAELKKALDEARKDFDRLCGGVTTTPPTPAPAPEEDLDCADFPLSSGRTAQQVLDETPGEDPHGLDADGDRRACEPGQDTAADGSDLGDDDDDVVVPSGGVATGGGPA
jgi:hypothetical protein